MSRRIINKSEEETFSSSVKLKDENLRKLNCLLEIINAEILQFDQNKMEYINLVLNKEDSMEITVQKINVYLPYAEFIKKLKRKI